MKGSIISVVLTLTVLLLTSFGAADFSWESISPSSQNNTDHHGANECLGLHCLIAVDSHETDLFMDQLKGAGNNHEAIKAVNSMQPHDCKVKKPAAYKGSSCTNNVSPQIIKFQAKRGGCPPGTYRGDDGYKLGCPQNL